MTDSWQLPGGLSITVNHLGYLTEDLDRSIGAWTALGVEGFQRFDGPTTSVGIARLPLAIGFGPATGATLSVELTMPTAAGLFSERMTTRGPGLDHIGVNVPNFAEYFDAFTEAGCIMILDMRKATVGADSVYAQAHQGLDACFLDCQAIGLPNIEIYGP